MTISSGFLKPKENLITNNTLEVEDWMIHCCQQIGLMISSKYADLKESFENISINSSKLDFLGFKGWIDKNNVLQGFNLTESLLQKLFAFIDPHKKGFITKNDWISTFKIFIEAKDIPLNDLSDLVYFTFPSIGEAFRYFQAY